MFTTTFHCYSHPITETTKYCIHKHLWGAPKRLHYTHALTHKLLASIEFEHKLDSNIFDLIKTYYLSEKCNFMQQYNYSLSLPNFHFVKPK